MNTPIDTTVTAPAAELATPAGGMPDQMTIILFSGDLDRALAAFVIANGALAMDIKVTMFFAFWGLNVLRKETARSPAKDLLARMFGWMMPKGAARLKLSKMHMMGMGTRMMKFVMRKKNVQSLPQFIEMARNNGVRFVACSMSMDVMGLKREELLDGVELGGVATFLGDACQSKSTLFI
ncbi:MAG: DsrE/DsrF/DrsH-like family protein [Candidatus Omnitrophica bacterium]|nr:DsrE/DsrF/DrsH-like family protein [Candidatus Omnitrophota bacterium]